MSDAVTKEQFDNWLENVVTKNVMEGIKNRIEAKSELLASGYCIGPGCAERYSNIVGYIAALNEILEIEVADVGTEYDH